MIKYQYYNDKVSMVKVLKETEKTIWYSYDLSCVNLKDCLCVRKDAEYLFKIYDSIKDIVVERKAFYEKSIKELENDIVMYKEKIERLGKI